MEKVGLVYLDIPLSIKEHIHNFAIIQYVINQVDRGAYFILRGDTKNLTIESIAQYYSEILSIEWNKIGQRAFIVLPFNSAILTEYIEYLSLTTDKNSPCEYILFVEDIISEKFTKSYSQETSISKHTFKQVSFNIDEELMEKYIKIEKEFYPFVQPKYENDNYGKFNKVCIGGTFDHVHFGHYLLFTQLAMIFSGNGHIVIGISDGSLLENKIAKEHLESFEVRKANVEHCLMQIHPQILLPYKNNNNVVFDIMKLFEPYGPTITYTDIQALIVSEETRKGGEAVNRKRKELGMKPVQLFITPIVQPRNENCKLSSTQLRQALQKKV